MNQKNNLLKLILSSIVILILGTVFFLQKKNENHTPSSKVIFQAQKSMMFFGGSLVKSKYCNRFSSISFRVFPENKINYKKEPELRVTIDGEIDLDNSRKITKRMDANISDKSEKDWFGNKQNFWFGLTCSFKIPPYRIYKKEKIAILVELLVDGKPIDHLTKTIQYVEDDVEITSIEKVYFSNPGSCRPGEYFEEETLYAINKKGQYFMDKDMVTTIIREKNQFKIITDSPPGNLIFRADTSYKIPVPAFPQKIVFSDLSTDLIEGKYVTPYHQNLLYIIDEKYIGKFMTYKYIHQPIENIRTISHHKCDVEELDRNCFRIPAGIEVSFETYPQEINNKYITLY